MFVHGISTPEVLDTAGLNASPPTPISHMYHQLRMKKKIEVHYPPVMLNTEHCEGYQCI